MVEQSGKGVTSKRKSICTPRIMNATKKDGTKLDRVPPLSYCEKSPGPGYYNNDKPTNLFEQISARYHSDNAVPKQFGTESRPELFPSMPSPNSPGPGQYLSPS
jgi:hypothetical protein